MSNPSISPFQLESKDVYVIQDPKELPKEFENSVSSKVCMEIYKHSSNPGSIIHSLNKSVLITSFLFNGSQFRVKNHPMIKVFHHEEGSELCIPILEESEKLGEMLSRVDSLSAVLVRGGGLYVWGKDLDQAYIQ